MPTLHQKHLGLGLGLGLGSGSGLGSGLGLGLGLALGLGLGHQKHRGLEGAAGSPTEEALLAARVVIVGQRLRGVADLVQRQSQVEPPLLNAGARHRLAWNMGCSQGAIYCTGCN